MVSSAPARNCSGDDSHYRANHPSQHYHYRPMDVPIFAKRESLTDTKLINVARNVPDLRTASLLARADEVIE